MSYNVIQIANKIIDNTDFEHGELISNLKLQKLLYYVQGFNLAIMEKPLFSENIEAWQYGPVVREVYFHFKSFGAGNIRLKSNFDLPQMTIDEEKLFNEVMTEYGKYSAVRLMEMTHEELPWKTTFAKNPQGIIDNMIIAKYFKENLIE